MDLELKLKNVKLTADGPNLYDHLVNIMGKMILDKVENPLEKFEEYSEMLKNEHSFAGFIDDPKSYKLILGIVFFVIN